MTNTTVNADNKANEQSSDGRVFFSNQGNTCKECNAEIENSELIFLCKGHNVLCLSCADLDHLEYLPSGDTALTTRARKYSSISEIVWKFSKARKRNERQGVLVTKEGLEKAEQECFSDAEIRERNRTKAAEVRKLRDVEYINKFAAKIREMFPGCPGKTDFEIADHACEKYSMRVGRSASAKMLDQQSIILAVRAHIRHRHTEYDSLLAQGHERYDARELVSDDIEFVLAQWKKP